MKLIRGFIAFVIISFVVGVGGAFNGKSDGLVVEPDEIINQEQVAENVTEELQIEDKIEKQSEEKINIQQNEKKEEKNVEKKEINNSVKVNEKSTVVENKTEKSIDKAEKQVEKDSNKSTGKTNSTEKNKVTTSFYDSITHGIKEFSSESECFARGTQIQNAELDYVLNYNEQHPDNQIQPDINYFRCYPVIDEQGEGWYLHFFCNSGEGNDSKLKSMY